MRFVCTYLADVLNGLLRIERRTVWTALGRPDGLELNGPAGWAVSPVIFAGSRHSRG